MEGAISSKFSNLAALLRDLEEALPHGREDLRGRVQAGLADVESLSRLTTAAPGGLAPASSAEGSSPPPPTVPPQAPTLSTAADLTAAELKQRAALAFKSGEFDQALELCCQAILVEPSEVSAS